MLSILLTVLKVIGILLLILLGILVVLLCTVLFVPTRYMVTASKKEEIQAKISLSWLLRLAYVTVRYEDSKLFSIIRIFGFRVYDSRKPKKNMKKRKKTSSKKGKKQGKRKKQVKSDQQNETLIKKNESVKLENASEQSETLKEEVVHDRDEYPKKKNKGMKNRIRKIIDTIRGIPKKVRDFVENLLNKMKKVIQMSIHFLRYPAKIKEFISAKENQSSIKLFFETVKNLIKHAKPRKIKGYLKIGFDDPSTLGKIIGVISIVYAYLGLNKFEVIPDFEQEVFEGEIYLKGRIYSVTVLRIILRLLRNEDFKGLKDRLSSIKEE